MQRDIGIGPFQSKLQTHVVDIVYLAEMIYLEHMKESINLKYVSVNSLKSRGNIIRHCISTKDYDSSCPQRVDVIFAVALSFVLVGKSDNFFRHFSRFVVSLVGCSFWVFSGFPGDRNSPEIREQQKWAWTSLGCGRPQTWRLYFDVYERQSFHIHPFLSTNSTEWPE